MKKQNLLKRLEQLESDNTKEPYFIVEYEDGVKKRFNGHELIMHSLRQTESESNNEFPLMAKIYCRPEAEEGLSLPLAILESSGVALPEVNFL